MFRFIAGVIVGAIFDDYIVNGLIFTLEHLKVLVA